MSNDLSRLREAFPAQPPAPAPTAAPSAGDVTTSYDDKLRRLGQKWTDLLNTTGTVGDYNSPSEADMAIVAALVKRNFTDGEVRTTLQGSARYQDRVQRKGQRHTDNLYTKEIQKARGLVVPFPPDPPRQQRSARPRAIYQVSAAPRPTMAPTPVTALKPPPFALVTGPDSFITKYVEYAAKRTDAPLEAHELMAIGAMSALAGPIVRLPIATSTTGWRLVLWTCYIVNSTVGRKSTVINLIQDILEPILGKHALLLWEGSPQGFIQRLQERDGQTAVFLRDEYSGLMQQMNRGGHMAGLAQMLIRAYDGGTIENIRVKKKNRDGEMEKDEDRVNDPYLTTISASTYTSFVERATIDNVLDGFLARFIFVTGAAEPRRLPGLTRDIKDERDALCRRAEVFVERAREMPEPKIDDAVFDAAWETEQRWLLEADASDHPDALAASYKRLSESVLKVAALLAIDEGGPPIIELRHYQAALSIAEQRWKRSTRDLVERLGATEFLRNCDLVMASVRKHPGIALSQLYRAHRKLRKRDFDEVLGALGDQEQIQIIEPEPDGERVGRPPTLIYPVASDEVSS